jgi:SAM-dependent methyltransferase
MLRRLFGSTKPAKRPHRVELCHHDVIARLVPGRSFMDVGCMWAIHGAWTFHAVESGAARVVGVDVNEATPEFLARNATGRVEFVRGDVNDVDFAARVGPIDVVMCTAVLNHAPEPLRLLQALRAVCRSHLVLGVPTLPELDMPHGAVFLPFLTEAERAQVDAPLGFGGRKPGIDTPFDGTRCYANWFWLFSQSCVQALVRAANFEVAEVHTFPRYITIVGTPGARGIRADGDPAPIVRPPSETRTGSFARD